MHCVHLSNLSSTSVRICRRFLFQHNRARSLLRLHPRATVTSMPSSSTEIGGGASASYSSCSTAASAAKVLSNHYQAHANDESYDDSFFYEPGAYMEHLANLVRDRLQLGGQPFQNDKDDEERCILDIGGGTGTFAQTLVRDSKSTKVVVVDPFLNMADSNASPSVSFVKASAEDFLLPPEPESWRTKLVEEHGGYDQILVKEVVHHFQTKDRVGIFRGMKEGLRHANHPSGESTTLSSASASPSEATNNTRPSVLIITRPQVDIDYPLWDAALEVWKENQPSIEAIEADLLEAGYTHLKRDVEPVECSITLSRWQTMVQSRCWSTFSNFTDDELRQACQRIAQDAAQNPKTTRDGETQELTLHFQDRLIFLEAA